MEQIASFCMYESVFLFRILLDRAYCDWDAVYHELGLGCPIDSFIHQSVSTSCHTIIRTSASVPSFSYSSTYSLDLSQVLHNIKTCRWRHFKPWTALTLDLNNLRPCSAQKLSCGRYGPARNQANIRPAVPPATPGVYQPDFVAIYRAFSSFPSSPILSITSLILLMTKIVL